MYMRGNAVGSTHTHSHTQLDGAAWCIEVIVHESFFVPGRCVLKGSGKVQGILTRWKKWEVQGWHFFHHHHTWPAAVLVANLDFGGSLIILSTSKLRQRTPQLDRVGGNKGKKQSFTSSWASLLLWAPPFSVTSFVLLAKSVDGQLSKHFKVPMGCFS